MKGGINYSDIVTTVSRTYAEEIKTPVFGEKLDGILRARSEVLYGIENGIDCSHYNPADDNMIYEKYSTEKLHKKAANKIKLQKRLKLVQGEDIPVIGMVTRLVKQKGIDLILTKLEEGYDLDAQFVVLGTGEKYYEEMFHTLQKKHPGKISINVQFNDDLAHKIYAASDIFLMPSLFEPCGLGQMIALRYGSIPLVRLTGGLSDTVTPFNENTGEGNGFGFFHYSHRDMANTLNYALNLYKNKDIWRKIMTNAMTSDNCWQKSSEQYEKLYKMIMGRE